MSETLWFAIGLLLIIEGIGPLLFPNRWQDFIRQISELGSESIRRIGGCLVVAGLVIVTIFASTVA